MKKKNKTLGAAITVGSALAGAALGAAAVVLSDKKNQAKIKKTIDGLSDDAVRLGKNIKRKADEFTKHTKKNEKATEKEVKEAVEKAAAKNPTPPTKK